MIAKSPGSSNRPDPRLRLDPDEIGLVELPRELDRRGEYSRTFYRRDTVAVARALLGAILGRRYGGRWYAARIVETEAYLGREDRAAHSWGGRRTPRVEPMYADGGHLYVFFVYGMHFCANVVTRMEGIAEAVLLRAAEPLGEAPPRLLSGPGRLCAALGITTADSGRDLVAGGPIRLFRRRRAPRVAVSTRIGGDYAGDARAWPLRFFDRDSPAVSIRPSSRAEQGIRDSIGQRIRRRSRSSE
jgi:DNA-3-methyladenine glycosylase